MLGLQHRLKARNSLIDLLRQNSLRRVYRFNASGGSTAEVSSEDEIEELPFLKFSPPRLQHNLANQPLVEAPLLFTMPSVSSCRDHRFFLHY